MWQWFHKLDFGIYERKRMDMSVKQEPPVAVVTGAASDIGKATALDFAKAGHKMSPVDCNEERLKKIISKDFSPAGGDHVY